MATNKLGRLQVLTLCEANIFKLICSFFRIHKPLDARDWLVLLWITAEKGNAILSTQTAQTFFCSFDPWPSDGYGIVGIQTHDLTSTVMNYNIPQLLKCYQMCPVSSHHPKTSGMWSILLGQMWSGGYRSGLVTLDYWFKSQTWQDCLKCRWCLLTPRLPPWDRLGIQHGPHPDKAGQYKMLSLVSAEHIIKLWQPLQLYMIKIAVISTFSSLTTCHLNSMRISQILLF